MNTNLIFIKINNRVINLELMYMGDAVTKCKVGEPFA